LTLLRHEKRANLLPQLKRYASLRVNLLPQLKRYASLRVNLLHQLKRYASLTEVRVHGDHFLQMNVAL
jgi:hypothetical protein